MKDTDTGIYMENETLGNFARNTASAIEPEGYVRGARCAGRIHAVLRRLRERLAAESKARGFSEAREWFSDNWYIAEREGKDAASRLAEAGRLPRCAGSDRAAVSEAACALVRSGRGEVTGDRIHLFLNEYQKVRVLTERELSVFVPALKGELCAFLEDILPADPAGMDENRELAMLLRNIFTSLRTLSGIDLSDILEEVNRVEAALRRDPAGIYPLMDEDTRRSYRRTLASVAARAGMSEYDAANKILELCGNGQEKHVGAYIFTRPLGREKKPPTGGWYLAVILLGTLFFSILAGVLTGSPVAPVLLILPVSELVKCVVDHIALRAVRPRRLPRMELPGGIPKSARTICVISALLTSPEDGKKFARLMEEYRLLNRDAGENLIFGVLADLRESRTRQSADDGRILDGARAAVEELNKKYSGGFYLLTRDRELNQADGIWMGRERKRGAIEELVMLLSGEKSALRALAGDADGLRGVKFIITLDADTRLTAGAAKELVGAALHPLNTPVIDEKQRRVVSGYGIFEPRVAVDLRSAGRSDFSRIFAGEGGFDPYGSAVSDLYQDLFSEGTFMGKGLINVPVYRKLLCGAFPENTVLSHDILEGAYMRCGFMSDLELADGCPYKITSYFSREERWVRGDWQNIRWCTGWVKNPDGTRRANTLTAINRWKLVDNLRRSLVPPAIFVCIMAAILFSGRALNVCAVVAAAAWLSGLILSSAELIVRHDGSSKARYQSAIISGLPGILMRSVISLMLLPAEAFILTKAAVTAIYRMAATHRRMLAWVTSSEAERRGGNTLLVNYRVLLACPIAGVLAIALTPHALGAALGIVWLFAPAYAWALSREVRSDRHVSQADRAYLLSCARDIWRYFDENLTAEDNFLPPDNVQEEPCLGPAHRTSPTNIGLAMLSCAAASDLGLIGEREASELVKKTLDTCEKLTKWRGHLLNWYDTRTLQPLEPRYVSSVDSGNFLGALIAINQWFLKNGDPDAAGRCMALVDGTDLAALFDKKRRLFFIGWDLSKDAPTEGWYDLLASEARQTSFIAVALGAAPKKHWRRLGRALVSQDNYSGMASWTGTMFEYLMPNLLLPCPEDSLISESSRFCLYAQRHAHPGIPWGISESAFYAFDPGLSYRYKAHGVQRLALKRGMGAERVISPYSTFLALPLDPAGAVKNLKRLASLGLTGPMGFYEAADFTPSRMTDGKCQIVRAYMAHHLGMSLIAIANTLCDGIFQRRFMADRRMGAYRELLEERVPTGQVTLRQPPRDVPEKPRRAQSGGYRETFTEVDALEPACVPLSNGAYTLMFFESGHSRSIFRDMDMTLFEPIPTGQTGMAFYIRYGDRLIPLTAAPEFDPSMRYTVELTDSMARVRVKLPGLAASLTAAVPPGAAGETRCVEVVSSDTDAALSLVCFFRPVLQRRGDYLAHPAFSRLSLEADMASGILTIRRRPKPGDDNVFFSVTSDAPMRAVNHRRRGEGPEAGEFLPCSPDMSVTVTVPIRLTAGRGRVTLAFAAGFDREETRAAAARLISWDGSQSISRLAAAALMLGMRQGDMRWALALIPALTFGTEPSQERLELRAGGRYSRRSLWGLGISGDLPLIAGKIQDSSQLESAGNLIRRHALLSANGVRSDLALVLTDGGDYLAPQRTAISELLRSLGLDASAGRPGGLHLIDGDRGEECLRAMADVYVNLSAIPAAAGHRQRLPAPHRRYLRGAGEVKYRLMPSGEFKMALTDRLPDASWSHILANDTFGCLVTEWGPGYMWYKNSRLMKLTPAPTDAMETSGSERLTLTLPGGEPTSLFADGSGIPTFVEYGFGYAVWERDLGQVKSRVTVFVPPELSGRILTVELSGELEGAAIDYFSALTMSEDSDRADTVITGREGRALTARSAGGYFPSRVLRLTASQDFSGFTTETCPDGRPGPEGYIGAPRRPCFAVSFKAEKRLVIAAGCEETPALERAASDAGGLLARTREYWAGLTGAVRVETPDDNINAYMSGWAVYQTVACRIMARTGLYQNGGATGFRDQLQDACAMLLVDPALAKRQILQAAAHQYAEGDVMHWWHGTDQGDMGVRTRCSDDLLWLPWAVAEYVSATGDTSILSQKTPYLVSPALSETERDRYERPETGESGTVLEHAVRACDKFISRGAGAHGLALMLGGDWNDGFDGVGAEGRGESTWLTFFGAMTLRAFAQVCDRAGETRSAQDFRRFAGGLMRAGEFAWTGMWYLRGYYDDGSPLGAPGDGECEIDSIAQSFAVLAGADSSRARQAVLTAYERLFDPASRTARLFAPPFDRGGSRPGYIKSYAPGFRENGGQYTHAAVWLAMALCRVGETDRAASLLSALSPWGRDESRYVTEPYALTGDVYFAPGLVGRGGWSWYTGSAGWYFRAVTQELLGLKLSDGALCPAPSLPGAWQRAGAVIRRPDGSPVTLEIYPEGTLVNGEQSKNGDRVQLFGSENAGAK